EGRLGPGVPFQGDQKGRLVGVDVRVLGPVEGPDRRPEDEEVQEAHQAHARGSADQSSHGLSPATKAVRLAGRQDGEARAEGRTGTAQSGRRPYSLLIPAFLMDPITQFTRRVESL